MLCFQTFEVRSFDFAQFLLEREAGLFLKFTQQITHHNNRVTVRIFTNGVIKALMHRDAEVGGKGPRRGRPDRD